MKDAWTWCHARGGNPFYKALSHPACRAALAGLRQQLVAAGPWTVYDPLDQFLTADALIGLADLQIRALWHPDLERSGQRRGRLTLEPPQARPAGEQVLVLDFDPAAALRVLGPLIGNPAGIQDLAALKLPADWVGHPGRYLDRLNFVTNWARFHDAGGRHTRISTASYWQGRGAREVRLRALLFDDSGRQLAEFERLAHQSGQSLVLDSAALKAEAGLDDFSGHLFLHAVGARGHDVLKYALDFYDDDGGLTATHDANAWPARRYGGIPAPRPGERGWLWLHNPHPRPIPAGAMALESTTGVSSPIPEAIAPFGSLALPLPADQGDCLTLRADQHVARPRYALERRGRHWVAHANVVREDLTPDDAWWQHRDRLGRGYLLVAPLLPADAFITEIMVTPMGPARPGLTLRTLDRDGALQSASTLPSQPRWIEVQGPAGHLELSYDDKRRDPVDGWLHAVFRYTRREGRQRADTSFGSHLFNLPVVWRGEPQSYAGPPPGLTTRLFARLGEPLGRSFICLIYPSSAPWREQSTTRITLHGESGETLASHSLAIPRQGSRRVFADELFQTPHLQAGRYLVIDDRTCRLFGYHGLMREDRFSLDHLFGF